MNSFVASHPFPTYQEMRGMIERYPDATLSTAMWAEFGRLHHAALKAAYESGMNRDIVRKAGIAIKNMGGMHAMQMNYYIFAHFSPFRLSNNPDIQYAYKQLEYGWDGVGDWTA